MKFSELGRIVARRRVVAGSTSRGVVTRPLIARLCCDDEGQDLIEYVLLASFIGLVGLLAYQFLGDTMRDVYTGWDSSVQSQWQTPAPASGS